MESHARDLDNYVNVARNRRRRAKALLDFERHDDDELGFRKNDIITVSSFFIVLSSRISVMTFIVICHSLFPCYLTSVYFIFDVIDWWQNFKFSLYW